jgi:hypothetical protein
VLASNSIQKFSLLVAVVVAPEVVEQVEQVEQVAVAQVPLQQEIQLLAHQIRVAVAVELVCNQITQLWLAEKVVQVL